MELRKEDLEKKQDAVADELCALLEKAGRGGASSRVFEIPEFARRTIDISLSKGELTGHMKGLVINDWKRKNHHEGDTPEKRMPEHELLLGVALILKKEGLKVFSDVTENLYVLGIEPYGGLSVVGLEDKPLYQLYVSHRTNEAIEVTSDGKPLRSYKAEMHGHILTLKGWFRKKVLEPFELSEKAYIERLQAQSGN